jgi:MFS family permease
VSTKPLGAMILGRIGDIYGRNRAITIAMIATSIASFIICILPTYQEIGIAAAFILSVARMIIAASTSSGSDGVRIYVYEKIDPKYKNFGSGLSAISTITGSLLASYSAWFFTQESFEEHSWRYTFLIGSCASLAVCILRQFVEKDSIEKEQNYVLYKEMTLLNIIRQNLKLFILCTIIAGTIGASYGFNFTFFVNHNAVVLNNISSSDMQFYRSIGIALYIVFAIMGGWLADVFNSRICASSAIVTIILLNILNCYLIEQGLFYISLYLLISALLPIAIIPALTLLNSAIPKVIRYRIFSMCHSWI